MRIPPRRSRVPSAASAAVLSLSLVTIAAFSDPATAAARFGRPSVVTHDVTDAGAGTALTPLGGVLAAWSNQFRSNFTSIGNGHQRGPVRTVSRSAPAGQPEPLAHGRVVMTWFTQGRIHVALFGRSGPAIRTEAFDGEGAGTDGHPVSTTFSDGGAVTIWSQQAKGKPARIMALVISPSGRFSRPITIADLTSDGARTMIGQGFYMTQEASPTPAILWEQDGPAVTDYHLLLRKISPDGSLTPAVSVLPQGEYLIDNDGEPSLSEGSDGVIAVSWLATLDNRVSSFLTRPEMRFVSAAGVAGDVISLEPIHRGQSIFTAEVHELSDQRALIVIAGPRKMISEVVAPTGAISEQHIILGVPTAEFGLAGNGKRAVVGIWAESARRSSIYAVDLSARHVSRPQLLVSGSGRNQPSPSLVAVNANARGEASICWAVSVSHFPFSDGTRVAVQR